MDGRKNLKVKPPLRPVGDSQARQKPPEIDSKTQPPSWQPEADLTVIVISNYPPPLISTAILTCHPLRNKDNRPNCGQFHAEISVMYTEKPTNCATTTMHICVPW